MTEYYLKKELREQVYAKPQRCTYCLSDYGIRKGKKIPLGFDHIIPISKGGLNEIENCVPCCFNCNASKNNFSLPEWFKSVKKKMNSTTDIDLKNRFTRILTGISTLLEDTYVSEWTEKLVIIDKAQEKRAEQINSIL